LEQALRALAEARGVKAGGAHPRHTTGLSPAGLVTRGSSRWPYSLAASRRWGDSID
jgi:hypothetical protein